MKHQATRATVINVGKDVIAFWIFKAKFQPNVCKKKMVDFNVEFLKVTKDGNGYMSEQMMIAKV